MLQPNKTISPRAVPRPKVAPLSVLPVFFNLQDATVLVVGNSEGVAWKTELLLAAGAQVRLVADNPSEDLKEIIENKDYNLIHHHRSWIQRDFSDVRLALGDLELRSEAERFSNFARKLGVSVNVIDKPEFCDFQFGSIVNRSPVVVSISTTGAAPILAQTIRTRIETMLPMSIAQWASRAKTMRHTLSIAVPSLKTRKVIWQDFARQAFTQPVEKIDRFFKSALTPKLSTRLGRVTLVGAGPGDAQLLTIQAVRALQSADVILFDRLVSNEVLELARREARRMLVGKRGGQESCRQDDINALMIKLAKQGKNVVRLKSGDPMIFGRAGEEVSILESEGIEIKIVPGITTAMAAASRLGVSLTHRDCAQSVKFITAHSRQGELPDIDWKSCTDSHTTLMVYMGAKTAPKLAEALIRQGANPVTPVMIAKGVSRPEEEVTYHRLNDLLTMDIDRKLPVLMGIGDVFAAKLIAFENCKFQNTPLGEARILTA
ncbi:MAG: siroheme synthase CysG [Maricaulaceae bacterium]